MANQNQYIKPPTNENSKINNNNNKDDEYVKPPSKEEEYVKPPENEEELDSQIIENSTSENNEFVDPYKNPSYFSTPKVGIKFYINSYIIFSSIFIIASFDYSFKEGMLYLAYFLLTNYTYSWYADYRRYVGGRFSSFFNSYGAVNMAKASSKFMNYHESSTSTNWLGETKTTYRRDVSTSIFVFFIVLLFTELIKYFITIPLAFLTLFFHKRTIRKYNEAVDNNN